MNEKIYTFKVSADDETYRLIEISGEDTLHDFAECILESFDFDMDHAFGFYNNYKNIHRSNEIYELFADLEDCESSDKAQGVYETAISSVFQPKKKMAFLFDYGDEWIFLIECKAVSQPPAETEYPRVIEVVGKPPVQYPVYEE